MKRALLIVCFLFVACLLHGQEAELTRVKALLDQANDLVLDGKWDQAKQSLSSTAQRCRELGEAFLPEEMEALFSLLGLTEEIDGKKSILLQMQERVAAAQRPPRPAFIQAYLVLAEANINAQENHLDQSLDPVLNAYKALRQDGSDDGEARQLRATLFMMAAQSAFELGAYQNALDLYKGAEKELGQPSTRMEMVTLGSILTLQGGTHKELVRFAEARQCFDRAEAVLRQARAEQSVYFAQLLVYVGALQGSQKNYKQAVKNIKRALDLYPPVSTERTEMLLLYVTYALSTQDMSQADAGLKEAEQMAGTLQMRPQWWLSYYQCLASRHLIAGQVKNAIEATDKAIEMVEKEHIFNPKLISSLYNQLSADYQMLGDAETAKAYKQLSEYVLTENYGKEYIDKEKERRSQASQGVYAQAERLMDEVDRDLSSGRPEAGLKKIEEILSLYRQNGVSGMIYLTVESTKLPVLESIGDEKRLKKAAEEYLADLRADVRLNLSYMTEQEREIYYAGIMPYIGYAYLAEKKTSLAAPVYNAVLLRKNFILGAGLSLEKLIADSGDASLQGILAEMKALRSGPAADESLPSQEREAAIKRATELENKLVKDSHDYGDFLALSDIRWEDVRDALGPDEVAVEYIQAGSEKMPVYCALLLRSGWKQPQCVILSADEDHLMAALADPQYNQLVYGQPNLYTIFWTPLESYIKPGEKVFFAMDGFLNAFAFEHFLTEKGDRAMDRYQLHRVSSTRELIGRKKPAQEHTAALFGGFDYNLSGEEVSYYASTSRSGSSAEDWGYLPGSLAEVEAAGAILKGKLDVALYTAEEGLESRFKSLSGDAPDLIHVATHGYYYEGNEDPMERSGLVFSGANALREEGPAESGEDGLLKASEIALLDLRGTDLIVLSACQSGVGSISSDGVYGLQRAFKKAGVHSILMSLWKVDDRVTAEMMRLFYSGLSSGQNSRESFQAAREALRKTYPDPLLWAPFVLLER